jgi:ABC-type amino acid transport substrate-binding protein
VAPGTDIRIGVDPSRLPLEFLDATKVHSGIASDYVRLLNERLTIHMAPVPGLTWPEVLVKARTGEIDLIPCITKTPEREKLYLFTKPYLSIP